MHVEESDILEVIVSECQRCETDHTCDKCGRSEDIEDYCSYVEEEENCPRVKSKILRKR